MTPSIVTYQSPPADLRAETRTHLLLVANLSAGGCSTTVHIRNLSAAGALIEGSALPDIGVTASISRGSLNVEGVLAWKAKNQAGIAFRTNIVVSAWLPRKSGSRQCAIDKLVLETKDTEKSAPQISSLRSAPAGPSWAIEELNSIRSDLASLGNSLIQDVILIATYPEIQVLDAAIQKIDRLLSRAEGFGRVRDQEEVTPCHHTAREA